MKRLRLAVIGCGAHSTLYQLPALVRCPMLELTAVVDADADWAKKVAGRFRVPEAYSDSRTLFGRVDAALIATPNGTHRDIAIGLLEHGVHVLCEKPLATSVADATRMFDVAKRHRTSLMAAHCLRFSPNFQMLERIVRAGWLGDLQEIQGSIGGPYSTGAHRTDFRRNRRMSGGGVLMDLGIHLIDLSTWLVGVAPVDVACERTSVDGWEVETDARVRIEYPAGVSVTLSCSFTRQMENVVTLRGSDGWATAPLYSPTDLTIFCGSARVCRRDGAQPLALAGASMYETQAAHFCETIRDGGEFLVRPEEVLAGLRTIERCYEPEVASV